MTRKDSLWNCPFYGKVKGSTFSILLTQMPLSLILSNSMLIFFRATVFMRRETAYDRLFESFLCKRKGGIILAIKTSSNATQKRINQYRLSSNFMFPKSNWDKNMIGSPNSFPNSVTTIFFTKINVVIYINSRKEWINR